MEEEVFEEFRKLDDLSRLLYFQSFSKKRARGNPSEISFDSTPRDFSVRTSR